MVDAGPEIGDQLEPIARRANDLGIDLVGHGRHQHVAVGDRGLEFVLGKGVIVC